MSVNYEIVLDYVTVKKNKTFAVATYYGLNVIKLSAVHPMILFCLSAVKGAQRSG